MLLDFLELVKKYDIRSNGVIHVGAHYCEELSDYVAAGIKKYVLVEPCKESFDELTKRMSFIDQAILFNCACGDTVGKMEMNTGSQNKGQSNSLLKMEKHLDIHPGITLDKVETVQVELLDNIMKGLGIYRMLVMDCQGYEDRVLRGATRTLEMIDYIYTEVNQDEVYRGCARVEDMDNILYRFKRVETGRWIGGMWTDALYIRRTLLKNN